MLQLCVDELFERWQVGVDGDAAKVIDEGKVFGNVRRGPGVEEAVEDPLVSACTMDGWKWKAPQG